MRADFVLDLLTFLLRQDNRRMPVYNPAGKYLVKLTVNGVARKVCFFVFSVVLDVGLAWPGLA